MKADIKSWVERGRLQVHVDLQTKGDAPGHPFRGNQFSGGGSQPMAPGIRGRVEVLDKNVKTAKVEFLKRSSEVREAIDSLERARTDAQYDRMFAKWKEREAACEKMFVKAEGRWDKAAKVLGGLVDFMFSKSKDDQRLKEAMKEAEAALEEMRKASDQMEALLKEIREFSNKETVG